jgi:hypothetical protein
MSTKLPIPRKNYLVVAVVLVCMALVALDRLITFPLLRELVNTLWSWVIVLAACALLLGAVHVMIVHLRRVIAGSRSWANSMILVATALVVFVLGLLGPSGSESPFVEWVFDSILWPGLATLFALLAFFTVAAAYRYLRIGGPSLEPAETERVRPLYQGGGWMLAGAVFFLLLQTPLIHDWLPPAATGFAGWVLDVPAMATLRGALLGSSIALVVMGMRLALLKG